MKQINLNMIGGSITYPSTAIFILAKVYSLEYSNFQKATTILISYSNLKVNSKNENQETNSLNSL